MKTLMTNEIENVGGKFWTQWVLIYVLTFILSTEVYIGDLLTKVMGIDIGTDGENWGMLFSVYLIAAIITGLIIGLMQWFVLRAYGIPSWWILTAIGIIMGGFSFFIVSAALLQSFILWKRVSYAGIWFAANSVTLLIYSFMSVYLYKYIDLTSYTIIGLLGGVITASVLVWLLRQPKSKSTSQPG